MNELSPSVTSQNKALVVNADGSVDVFFGPRAPAGMENNWVQTIPGKGWNTLLRLYGPLQPWFDKTWRAGEIVPVIDVLITPRFWYELGAAFWHGVLVDSSVAIRSAGVCFFRHAHGGFGSRACGNVKSA